MNTLFLTPSALAERWNLSASTLSQWRWSGKGPSFLKIGRHILYRLQEVEDFERVKSYRHTTEQTVSAAACSL